MSDRSKFIAICVFMAVALVGSSLAWDPKFAPVRTRLNAPAGRQEVREKDPAVQAPIPSHIHFKNEGGSDGSGLCVICSTVYAGQALGIPGFETGRESATWRAAKQAPGGYHPSKWEALMKRTAPQVKYVSETGDGKDTSLLERLLAKGIPLGVTMNTGELYSWQTIAHMVNLVHLDRSRGVAAYIDNNDPGYVHVIGDKEFDRRFPHPSNGEAWMIALLPDGKSPGGPPRAVLVAIVAAGGAFIVFRNRQQIAGASHAA